MSVRNDAPGVRDQGAEEMVCTAGAAWLGVTGGVPPPVRRIALGRLRGRESAR
jgi:hypothetical protein